MDMQFSIGEQVWHLANGSSRHGTVVQQDGQSVTLIKWNDNGKQFAATTNNLRRVEISWSSVEPGDTVKFEDRGDIVEVKARGHERVTVLGFNVTQVDNIWKLLSIKKKNPPIPKVVGSRVLYRGEEYMLLAPHMLNTRAFDDKVWVRMGGDTFGWVGHKDIDLETFVVTYDAQA